MKVLVTGGAGFIGSHLVDLLVAKNYDVRVLVRNDPVHPAYNECEDPDILKHVRSLDVEIKYGNLLDKGSLEEACKNIDKVYHLAAIAHEYERLPREIYHDINVQGTKNLLEASLKCGVKRFLYTSSIEATGPSIDGKLLTEKTDPHPVCIYGESKLGGEFVTLHYYKKFGLPVTIVRPPMTYGDRCALHERLFRNVKRGFFPIFGSGEGLFEFCYVKNQAYGLYLANEKKKAIGETYFISEGPYKIKDVVKKVGEVLNIDLKVASIPKPLGYFIGSIGEGLSKLFPFHPFKVEGTGRPYISRRTIDWTTKDWYVCDISKAKKELNYKPPYSLEEGLKRTIRWYKERRMI